MKTALLAGTVLLALSASCRRFETGPRHDEERGAAEKTESLISLEYLNANQRDFVDREVAVAAYLCTHEEGPWLASNPEKPLWDAMSLEINDSSAIVSKDLAHHRWWYQAEDGFPVVVTGRFRWKDKTLPLGEVQRNYPCIEVLRAREVSIDDPEWKACRNNRDQAEAPNRR